MITGGLLQKDKITFNTDSVKSALMLKGGLAGNNTTITISPYGNRVDFQLEGSRLILVKYPRAPFSYEEARGILKKVRLFGKLKKSQSLELNRTAREALDSHLTLFYPSKQKPEFEVTFAYNWAAISFENMEFDKDLYSQIRNAITRTMGDAVKVFSNHIDTISIHNYKMNGLYFKKETLEKMADVLVRNYLIEMDDKHRFVIQGSAFGIKCVSYLEARKLCQDADDLYEQGDDIYDSSSLIGHRSFLVPMLEILAGLSKQGRFVDLDSKQLQLLYYLHLEPERIETYTASETVKQVLHDLIEHFSQEILEASKHYEFYDDNIDKEITLLLEDLSKNSSSEDVMDAFRIQRS